MPLIVENGTGIATADSWVSLADANAWFADRNEAKWTAATVADREAALRKAADYLTYAYRWPGQPSFSVQRLPWPRAGVRSGTGYYPTGNIPSQIVDSQLLLALEQINGNDLLRRVSINPQLIEKTIAAKGLSKTLKYATSEVDPISDLRRFPLVDQILRGIALGSFGGAMGVVPLVRGR